MIKKLNVTKILLLSLLIIGLGSTSTHVYADKKATEGQNEADVEFYKPTPSKPDPVKPKPEDPKSKEIFPVKILPKTGEENLPDGMRILGMSVLGLTVIFFMKMKKVGDTNEE
ncbi:LPXTG cell wall anchor domain-containing protein [Vagococcus sp.]|uniref:LPXTG cell wall anchor domain-containing protein n=1 Tax=Vagococcus sp. TaxID=1933889 RepID=UPI002FC75532